MKLGERKEGPVLMKVEDRTAQLRVFVTKRTDLKYVDGKRGKVANLEFGTEEDSNRRPVAQQILLGLRLFHVEKDLGFLQRSKQVLVPAPLQNWTRRWLEKMMDGRLHVLSVSSGSVVSLAVGPRGFVLPWILVCVRWWRSLRVWETEGSCSTRGKHGK